MRMTIEEALQRVAERVAKNARKIEQMDVSRRNQVVDLYGVEYTRQGDKNNPASFYISISPDLVYLERFEFKLIIQPFLSAAGSGTTSTSLEINGDVSERTLVVTEEGTYDIEGYDNVIVNVDSEQEIPVMALSDGSGSGSELEITPNPHSHSIIAGITALHTTADDFRVLIEGIDVTAYLMAQHDGAWISGEGIYPSLTIGDNYDILEVAGDLIDEGRTADAQKLTRSGYKSVQVTSSQPFQVTLVNYLKYSHLNR